MPGKDSPYVGLKKRQAVKLAKSEGRKYRVLKSTDIVTLEGVPGRLTLWVEKGVVVAVDDES